MGELDGPDAAQQTPGLRREPARRLPRPNPGPRPEPGPVTTLLEGVALAEPELPGPAPRHVRRRSSRAARLRRRTARALRGRSAKVAAVVLACVAVLLIGLLVSGFLKSPVSSDSAGGSLGSGQPSGALPVATAPSVGGSGSPTGSTAPATPVNDPSSILNGVLPDNPLNHLRSAGVHRVVVSVSAGGGVPVIGYLIPTGLGQTYGRVNQRSWSMAEDALGPGYLAAVFIQAASDGAPVTCRVSVDGKVTDTKTTSGAYGRQVCLG